jgi:SAM-dependent methyltransferase
MSQSMTAEHKDTWAAGKFYEPYVGRWSRFVAKEFLAWLGAAPNQDWLDVGCGTGALAEVILHHAGPSSVRGMDPSAAFVEYARAYVTDPRATFDVADAQSLPVAAARFDAAVSGLVMNFVPNPLQAVREMARVVRPGGLVAAYVWDYAGKMDLMRYFWDAAVELDPLAVDLDEGIRFPLCRPEALTELFASAGLAGIGVTAIDIATIFASFADYWEPFLGGQGPAPAYAMSLDDAARSRLRDRIRERVPVRADGSISLTARAWAIRGTVAK